MSDENQTGDKRDEKGFQITKKSPSGDLLNLDQSSYSNSILFTSKNDKCLQAYFLIGSVFTIEAINFARHFFKMQF
jgi:hypothetical protein